MLGFFREERFKKFLFYGIISIVFIMIFSYNILTPYLSDDLVYRLEAEKAGSLWDLLVQQYHEYLNHNGRFIALFLNRLFLLPDKMIFNFFNSFIFILLVLLIYENIQMSLIKQGRKKYCAGLLFLIVGLIWRYGVEFGQTILWICGAFNYLWNTVIILGFITYYRRSLNSDNYGNNIKKAILCLLFGIAAGWCNENTSGGAFLLVMGFTLFSCFERKKAGKKAVLPYMITANLGVLGGLAALLLSPGSHARAALITDGYTGVLGYLSRIYKCTMTIGKLFFEPLCIFAVVTIWAIVCRKEIFSIIKNSVSFFIAAIATSYALVMISPPSDRAYFGAGIFLLIACLQSFAYIFYQNGRAAEQNQHYAVGRHIAITLIGLWFFFTYIGNLVNLARIYREEKERVSLLQEAVAAGETTVIVPQYRPEFQNRYSTAHNSDMTENSGYWINTFYQDYYQLDEIVAIPREEWEERFGEEADG